VRLDRGPRIRIRAEFGSPDFEAEYQGAITGRFRQSARGSPAAGTLAWLVGRYRETSAWAALSIATRRQRENIFAQVLASAGEQPFGKITAQTIVAGRERRGRTPDQARHFLDAMRGLFRWALVAKLVKSDPTAGVENPPRKKGAGFIPWTEEHVASYERRWPIGTRQRVVPALAADLVRRQVAVIVTVGGETSAAAAMAATATIPVVFNVGTDPVKLGLVTSLARPGGNATGVNIFTTELVEKRLGLLRDLVPAATIVAVLSNPNFPAAVANVRESEAAARAIGKEVVIFNASSDAEIETAFVNIVRARPGALLVGADPFFNSRRGLIVALAARHAIPAIYEWREFAEAGGLISYGTSLVEAYRQQGIYTGRILKGEKPADLPVVQLSKFELVINLNTGKALGLVIPPSVLALADEVIE
jgi:putative ABC transport system substrate-binding protein